MQKQGLGLSVLAFALCVGGVFASGPKTVKSKAAVPQTITPDKTAESGETKEAPAVEMVKPVLGDAFVAQNVLRVYLNQPTAISLHNARGQLLFHLDSRSPVEFLPLQGVNAGFLYLTLRSGQIELTKKLVYTGK